ncbi:hypothetical protein, partial [Pseudomonas coronafaciens]|uniref:hypothetical protein n=1 Tax=Pseudomonas coronafaciens TaxID=53409 RepID=UPI001C7EA846
GLPGVLRFWRTRIPSRLTDMQPGRHYALSAIGLIAGLGELTYNYVSTRIQRFRGRHWFETWPKAAPQHLSNDQTRK